MKHIIEDLVSWKDYEINEERPIVLNWEGVTTELKKDRNEEGYQINYCEVFRTDGVASIRNICLSNKVIVKREKELSFKTYPLDKGEILNLENEDVISLVGKIKGEVHDFKYFLGTKKNHGANIKYSRRPRLSMILSDKNKG